MNTKRNKLLYTLTIVIIAICFFEIILTGSFMRDKIYIDVVSNQPMNNIKAADRELIEYVYTEDKTQGNYIYLLNQFPIKDEIGKGLDGQFKTFDFKIEFSKMSVGVNYEITLEKLSGTNLEEDWVKVYLTREGKGINCYRKNGRVKTYNEYSKFNGNKEISLFKSVVTSDDVQKGFREFRLRMWISEDVTVENTDYLVKTFIARVNVHATDQL